MAPRRKCGVSDRHPFQRPGLRQITHPSERRREHRHGGQLDSRLRLAHCPPKDLSASLPAGMALQARATVGVTCAGPVHWTVYVPVTIESKIDVLVLTRAANRDERLTPADVTVETRRTTGPGNAYLTKPAELSGRTVRRPLPAGTTLSVDMFTPDLIVRRGQAVTLLSSGSAVEVRRVDARWSMVSQGQEYRCKT